MKEYVLYNSHLEGNAFLWEAGPVGVFLSHGFTATTAEVRLFARWLHEKGFSVGGPLLAGHGTR
ncbi:MAG: alpha/beta hydrolase, partial [Chloroflexota bacterium]